MKSNLNECTTVQKGWGEEYIWANTDKYCGKILAFNTGAKFSMHYHAEKEETWLVLDGVFLVTVIDTKTSDIHEYFLHAGDTWHNKPNVPHRLTCIREGRVLEVSTRDSVEDNYRVLPGDSQK